MYMFGYLKIPKIVLSLVCSQELDRTYTFGTYCGLNYDMNLLPGFYRAFT